MALPSQAVNQYILIHAEAIQGTGMLVTSDKLVDKGFYEGIFIIPIAFHDTLMKVTGN